MGDNDRLGPLGETAFEALSERARWLASSLQPDRTGKDLLVEWPPAQTEALDARPSPRKCNAQVKANRVGSRSVKVELSAAEWLVKDALPAFFVTPVFVADETVDHYVLFHVDGALLSRLLKRLRQAGVEGRDPHKQFVELTLSKGVKLKENAVRAHVETYIGTATGKSRPNSR